MTSTWSVVYAGACSENGLIPRRELKDKSDDDVQRIQLNGNCAERFSRRVNDLEAAALAQAVVQSNVVEELDLSYNEITDEGARLLADMLMTCTSLKYLNLAYNSIEHKGWRSIANCLVKNQSLLSLNIAGNCIGGASDPEHPELREIGGKTIGTVLRENHTLQELNFASCGLGVAAVVGLAQALIGHPSVVTLNIASLLVNNLQDRLSVAQHLSEMLRKNGTLVQLNLNRCLISDELLSIMLPAFVFNEGLTSILLSANKLSQDGAGELAKLLLRRHDLSVVDISSNNISSAGAAAIAATLKTNHGICSLNLSYCGVGEDGLVAVMEGLRQNTSISTLLLWGNHWTPKACQFFYAHRARLSELLFFDCEFQVVDGFPNVVLHEEGGIRSA
ncbi:FERM domain-containing protein C [Diplonema papillatum]|nr:FERM domain-containing protein C [Diplonema papillatum]